MTKTKQYIPNYTGYGWAGKSYDQNLSTKEIAALIRKEVRAKYPTKDGYKISVIYRSYSGGSSIDVTVKAAPFKVYHPEYTALCLADADYRVFDKWQEHQSTIRPELSKNRWNPRYTDETNQLLDELDLMISNYKRDDSDGMIDYFDTNFYGHATLDWQMSKEA